MCDPISLTFALGATALTAYGQIQQGKAAAQAAQVEGQQLNQQAGQQLDAANAQADLIRRAGREQAAQARAAFSASGVATDEGTPLKIAEQINQRSEFDALNTIISGGRQANTLSDDAVNVVRQGQAQKTAGYYKAAGTVLSSFSNTATASGWRSAGPGFSGTQAPAPIVDRSIRING